MKKTISFVCVCALALSLLAGCAMAAPATVMTVEGVEIPAGIYLCCQMEAYNTAQNAQADISVPVLEDTIEGVSGAEYIHEKTLEAVKRYVWTTKNADTLEVSDEDMASYIATAKDAYTQSEKWFAANGIGAASYQEYYTKVQLNNLLYAQYAESDEGAVSTEDAMAYMEETYAHVNVLTLLVTATDGSAASDDIKTAVQDAAQEVEDGLNDGGIFEELAAPALQKVLALTGREYTDTSLSQYLANTFVNADSTFLQEQNFGADMMSAEVGAVGQVENETAVYVYQKLEPISDAEEFAASYEASVVSEMQQKAFMDKIDAETADYTVEEDAAAVKTYSPKKIVEA